MQYSPQVQGSNYQPLFSFLSLVRPTWYFNLYSEKSNIWLDVKALSKEHQELLDRADMYNTETARITDLTYQATIKGLIPEIDAPPIEMKTISDPSENYIFLARYSHKIFRYYVLIIRILNLYNPIRELQYFRKSLNVKRYDPHKKTKGSFLPNSELHFPPVSVIIPTLNRYEYLHDVLRDLEHQDYPQFEVIVVDQSDPFDEKFYEQFKLDLKVIRQQEKALWRARNSAVRASRSEYILLFDDDSRVEKDWIASHINALSFYRADVSSGVSISMKGDKVPETYSYFRLSDQLDTGNVLLKKEVFREVGLFDEQFEKQRMGDGEFGLRLGLFGFRNVSNPKAKRIHLKVGKGGLRQMGSWDAYRTKKWWGPRPVPSVLYFFIRYFGTKAALRHMRLFLPASYIPYSLKSNRRLMALFVLSSFILLPFMLISGIQAWVAANKKIMEGPRIEPLAPSRTQ